MKKIIICSFACSLGITVLYVLGLAATLLLGLWVISSFIFALGEDSALPAIAFIPKWVFLFSFFVLLGKTKTVKKMLGGN